LTATKAFQQTRAPHSPTQPRSRGTDERAADERARAVYSEVEAARHELLQVKKDEVGAALQNIEVQEAAVIA
jgi:hypothetical protein